MEFAFKNFQIPHDHLDLESVEMDRRLQEGMERKQRLPEAVRCSMEAPAEHHQVDELLQPLESQRQAPGAGRPHGQPGLPQANVWRAWSHPLGYTEKEVEMSFIATSHCRTFGESGSYGPYLLSTDQEGLRSRGSSASGPRGSPLHSMG
jgi:hypothetical protein